MIPVANVENEGSKVLSALVPAPKRGSCHMAETELNVLSRQCLERRIPDKAMLTEETWLRVSGTAKMPQIDQSVRHQLHTVMTLLFELKAQQKPFEFVLPGEGPLHAEP